MASLFTRSFVALLLAQASFGFAFSSYFLLPKFLTTELGAGPAEIGLVGALWGGTYMLLGPLLGVVVDRRGRRPFLVTGALLWAVTSLAFAGVEELGAEVYVLRAIQGAAFAMAFVAGSALAVDEAPPDRLALAQYRCRGRSHQQDLTRLPRGTCGQRLAASDQEPRARTVPEGPQADSLCDRQLQQFHPGQRLLGDSRGVGGRSPGGTRDCRERNPRTL